MSATKWRIVAQTPDDAPIMFYGEHRITSIQLQQREDEDGRTVQRLVAVAPEIIDPVTEVFHLMPMSPEQYAEPYHGDPEIRVR